MRFGASRTLPRQDQHIKTPSGASFSQRRIRMLDTADIVRDGDFSPIYRAWTVREDESGS
jgi:hypothetical protein